jgi:hypothetical protein
MASFSVVAGLYVIAPLVLLRSQRTKANVFMTVGSVSSSPSR